MSYENALWTVQCQKAQLTAETLATMLQTGVIDKYATKDYNTFYKEVLSHIGLKKHSHISYHTIRNAYNNAYEKNKMGQALTYAIPGPKMVFQGDEKADLTPFRFFREFDFIKDEQYLYWEKGYKHGRDALEESKIGNIPYSKAGEDKCKAFENLTKDLNELSNQNTAMTKGRVIHKDTVKHYESKVFGIHTKDFANGNELFTISNTKGNRYPDGRGGDKYYVNMPEGKWVEVLNTNDKKYGGNGKFLNEGIYKDGQCAINLNSNSTIIFKRID